MRLVHLVHNLIEILADIGDCEAYITTENDSIHYGNGIVHAVRSLDEGNEGEIVLRLEGVLHNIPLSKQKGEDEDEQYE